MGIIIEQLIIYLSKVFIIFSLFFLLINFIERWKRKRMTYKEFKKWCNDRAFDGRWGMKEAIICCNVIDAMMEEKFWNRKKVWEKYYQDDMTKIVEAINKLIKKYEVEGYK